MVFVLVLFFMVMKNGLFSVERIIVMVFCVCVIKEIEVESRVVEIRVVSFFIFIVFFGCVL